MLASFLRGNVGVGRIYDRSRTSQSSGASLEKDDCVNGKQPQLLMKFQVVSKLSRSPPTLSTFSCLTSDSDAVLIERLHSHYKRSDTYSKRSAIIRFLLMRKLALGFATYQVRVCPISHVFGLHILFFRLADSNLRHSQMISKHKGHALLYASRT